MGTRALSLARVSLPWLWLSIRGISHQTPLPSVSLLRLMPALADLVRMRPVGRIVCWFITPASFTGLPIIHHRVMLIGIVKGQSGDCPRRDRVVAAALHVSDLHDLKVNPNGSRYN